jgi:hypothetical protein
MDEKNPSWLQLTPHLTNTLDTAAKLQRQIDEARRIEELVKDPGTHAFLSDALAGGLQRELLDYANLLRDHLHRFRDAGAALSMVELFRSGRDDECQEWLDEHRDSLSVEGLSYIIQAAMLEGVNEALGENGRKTRWTPEQLQELRDYRANHTAAETAEQFLVSERLVHRLLNPAKKQPRPRSVFDI